MNESVQISDNQKWQAVISCDNSYDGMFFYGVKTTGIFCRPSCRAKTPARENAVFFDASEKAINEGFRPCKRCCPERAIFEPELELVRKAKDIFDGNYTSQIEISNTARELGVSPNHLTRLFKRQLGKTPTQYITGLRVEYAVESLSSSDESVIEIAYSAGFKTLSNFYKSFKLHKGYSPGEQRKNGGRS